MQRCLALCAASCSRALQTGCLGSLAASPLVSAETTRAASALWPQQPQTHAPLHTSRQRQGFVERWEDARTDSTPDPFALVRDEVMAVSERLRHSINTDVPVLARAAEYFFRRGVEGKRLRPTLLLLLSSALSHTPTDPEFLQPDLRPPHEPAHELQRRQQRIAEIAELIHVASLLHDDVIDESSTRRGVMSLNASAGNKLAILAGDFLLARASVSLAALQNTEIVELLSRVLEHLVTGEVMQICAVPEQLTSMEHYLQKTFYKTASLMANSARAVAVLGGHQQQVCEDVWSFGRHLGLAFQIVDDVLDMTASSSMLGKPVFNDIKSGIATAPVLLAVEEQPGLLPLIRRKFKQEGDIAKAIDLACSSSGIPRAKEMAQEHARLAALMIAALPEAQHEGAVLSRQALVRLTDLVLARSK